MIVRDGSLTEVLELGDTAYVGGYLVEDYTPTTRTFRRNTVEADGVDGAYDVDAVPGRGRVTLTVLVAGASESETRTRRAALLDAVEQYAWVLEVASGVLLTCGMTDSQTFRAGAWPNPELRVVLTIPVQPGPNVY